MNDPQPIRRRPAHIPPLELHNRPVIILITVCSKDRRRIFANSLAADAFIQAWVADDQWRVGHYLIMPDHVHFFVSPGDVPVPSLTAWMQKWKSRVSRHWHKPSEQPIWQRGFWDRQIRDGEHYEARAEYVRQNPLRAGLCSNSKIWPWQGELNVLRW